MQFWIPGNVPSSKNSKRAFMSKGKQIVISSKLTVDYEKSTMWLWKQMSDHFRVALIGKQQPYRISFKFVRDSRRKFDYINPAQTVQDLMVKYGWIEDDNCDILIPVFEQFEYNKDNPGVMITIMPEEQNTQDN